MTLAALMRKPVGDPAPYDVTVHTGTQTEGMYFFSPGLKPI